MEWIEVGAEFIEIPSGCAPTTKMRVA